jgi:uncharacterized membrane protein
MLVGMDIVDQIHCGTLLPVSRLETLDKKKIIVIYNILWLIFSTKSAFAFFVVIFSFYVKKFFERSLCLEKAPVDEIINIRCSSSFFINNFVLYISCECSLLITIGFISFQDSPTLSIYYFILSHLNTAITL